MRPCEPRLIARVLFAGVVTSAGGIHAQDRPGSTLPYAEAAELAPLEAEPDDSWSVDTGTERGTRVAIPRGPTLTLVGRWAQRTTMWDDTALVFRDDGKNLLVLDGKSSKARLVWEYPHRSWSYNCAQGWSRDGSRLYAWLDFERQLTAIDVGTGVMRSLTELDDRVWNYKGDRHLDPAPIDRAGGVVEDVENGLLLFLLAERSNEHVYPWERRYGRGGCWLASLDLEEGTLEALSPKTALPPWIWSWDLSLSRDRLYVVHVDPPVTPDGPRRVAEFRLNGTLVREWPEPEGRASQVRLSPDGKFLLVGRAFKPGMPTPGIPLDDFESKHHDMYDAAEDGGFVLLDLDSEAVIDGPHDGAQACWAPDGDRIVYADGFSVRLGSVSARRSTTLIHGPPTGEWVWPPWHDFVWSPDGERLAMTVGGRDLALLIDLGTREYVLVPHSAQDKAWAPLPRPFPY